MAALSTKLALAACIACMLAACAEQPLRPQSSPSIAMAAPAMPAPELAALPPAAPPPDSWSRLRASFALDDCSLNPRVSTWAQRFTRDPARFEARVRSVLPLLRYVQDAAQEAQIPGEFVLLPMIESSYEPGEPGRNGDPAGMWQIMPQTARTLGLAVNKGYDGRLDPVASTAVVMKMLQSFHDDLHDWRLVDMAFNAGEYKMLGLMNGRGRPPVDEPLHLPVGSITNNHLAKLLAAACIIREPARFNVQLPEPAVGPQLAVVELPHSADLANAATLAHLPLPELRALNPGYLGHRMPTASPHHLLLPRDNADDLLAAVSANAGALLAVADDLPAGSRQVRHRRIERHKVVRGESLTVIARRYHLDTRELRAWNGLAASADVRPGQTIRLTAPD